MAAARPWPMSVFQSANEYEGAKYLIFGEPFPQTAVVETIPEEKR